jgi:hypothetical protein
VLNTSNRIKALVAVVVLLFAITVTGIGGIASNETPKLINEFTPLTDEERAYLHKYLANVNEDTVPLEDLKPLLDRAVIELDIKRYSPIQQELIDKGITSDPVMLEVGARWLFCARADVKDNDHTFNNTKISPDYGLLSVYEDQIIEFIRTGKGMEALYDLDGIPRVLLPRLEDGSESSDKFLELIHKAINLLQDNAPEGTDVVKWLWELGLDSYHLYEYNEDWDSASAYVTSYGKVASNFDKSDAENKKLYKTIMLHLIGESYSIAYQKLGAATLYNKGFSTDTIMSEVLKTTALARNSAFLMNICCDKDRKDFEFLMMCGIALTKNIEYRNTAKAQRADELLIMMAPSIAPDGSWDVVGQYDVKWE